MKTCKIICQINYSALKKKASGMKARAPPLVHNVADRMVHCYALIIQGILLYENIL